jgi:hypothetical protein
MADGYHVKTAGLMSKPSNPAWCNKPTTTDLNTQRPSVNDQLVKLANFSSKNERLEEGMVAGLKREASS